MFTKLTNKICKTAYAIVKVMSECLVAHFFYSCTFSSDCVVIITKNQDLSDTVTTVVEALYRIYIILLHGFY